MKKAAGYILIFLAIVMFYLAYKINGLPPAVTGVGFVVTAIVFLADKKESK